MTVLSNKIAEPQIRCRHCRAVAELFVSMSDPKDHSTLLIFRCRCGKLTSITSRP